ncbi:MAG: tannase/feruloyl esterase family alpha/beta hydrolase [Gemmatimonadaceae bacterium]
MQPAAAISVLAFVTVVASCAKADPCGQLATLSFPNTTISNAQLVAAGAFRVPGGMRRASAEIFSAFDRLPAFCRVQAVIAPSSDSHIEVEVWLPVSGWNGKFLGTGNGGYAGSLSYPRLGEAVNTGYVGASTDTGHKGDSRDSRWAAGHEEKQTDFDHRAIHDMTALAKATIQAFYGKPPAHSYFSSCSNGGRQGLMEAERYPADYDGIMAGAPAYHYGFRTFVSGRLDAFRDRGGKLVIYHGGADAPQGSIDYYRRLVARMGQQTVDGFLQLYIVPGMGHCGSGDVPNDVGQWLRPDADPEHSILSAVERWVESGVAPTSIVATQYKREGDVASGVVRTRRIFPARDSR